MNSKRVGGLLALALLGACGGGVQTEVAPGGGGTGVPAAAETIGSVTSLAPLIVNGLTLNAITPPVTPIIEDGDDDGRGLALGMILRASGAVGAEPQTRVVLTSSSSAQVRGPVSANSGELRVMGVQVIANNQTVFENQRADAAGPQIGDEMQVHGFPTADGRILATRLVRRASNAVYKTTGAIVRSPCLCPPDRELFSIGNLSVFVPSTLLAALPRPLRDGDVVRVKAVSAPVNNTVTAAEVKFHAGAPLLADAQASVQGVVSSVTPENSVAGGARVLFLVNGLNAYTTAQTQFVGEALPDLTAGRLVEVQGIARSDGIAASRLRFVHF
jgi:hypothetical protein